MEAGSAHRIAESARALQHAPRRGGRGSWRRFVREDEGSAAAVQFIAMVPLFVAFLALVSDFGGALWNQQALQNSLGASARYLSRAPLNAAGDAIATAQEAQAKRLAVCGRISVSNPGGACTPQYSWWTDPNSVSIALSAPDPAMPTRLENGFRVITVRASVTVPLQFLSLVGVDDFSSVTLSAEETARHIGS